jgi:isoleucyl-tRNA synthetase
MMLNMGACSPALPLMKKADCAVWPIPFPYCRFASLRGYHVERRFGWDCHGLPVEHEIDKTLNLTTADDVHQYGIGNYNEQCRSIVMRYSKEWERIVKRTGRWIDFENDYKTLNPSFMESVWWVFQRLHQLGLVYRGFKVMPYSTACNTPLSNFEAGMDYRDVIDPAIVVSFPVHGDKHNGSLVAWTTTPWTLPSNVALCVNPNFTYVKIRIMKTDEVYIVAAECVHQIPGTQPPANSKQKKKQQQQEKGRNKDKQQQQQPTQSGTVAHSNGDATHESEDSSYYEVLARLTGADLVGMQYEPLFEYFAHFQGDGGAFRVVADTYVSNESGTGIVHQAPAYGEDDFRVCLANGIVSKGQSLPDPVDTNGRFMDPVSDFAGLHVKDADKGLVTKIKSLRKLVSNDTINHSYPYCWRSKTPLIYKAVPSYFVAVEQIKDQLLANNSLTHWVPSHIKEKRFYNWLAGAHDWALSRNRYWGTPIPVWRSDDGREERVVGSIEELQQLSGKTFHDIHRHHIDDVMIPSQTGRGPLKRVGEVFDCWFESGSMPYAQVHYPFENKERFEENFPADFVAEGLDQTRGWFYTLMVLSTALFNRPAFKNLVCNGLVLAHDGKKMSKSAKNFPDPMDVISRHGADALRLFLVDSPVVRAETLRFKEEGVFAVLRDVFLPWYNAYRFCVQNAIDLYRQTLQPFDPSAASPKESTNVLDKWIFGACQTLIRDVKHEMDYFRLYTVAPRLVKFIGNLTNIYVRLNRPRLKGRDGEYDRLAALCSLYRVLESLCVLMAPFTPFFTETMYQNLAKALPESQHKGSVHWCTIPDPDLSAIDERTERSVERMWSVVEMGRTVRERNVKPVKQPLRKAVIATKDEAFLNDTVNGPLGEYIKDELNVLSLEACEDPLEYSTLRAEPNYAALGKRLGNAMKTVSEAVKALTSEQLEEYEREKQITVCGYELSGDDLRIHREFKVPKGRDKKELDATNNEDILVVLELSIETELVLDGVAREICAHMSKLRKRADLVPNDSVEVYYDVQSEGDGSANQVLSERGADLLEKRAGTEPLPRNRVQEHTVMHDGGEEVVSLSDGSNVRLALAQPTVTPDRATITRAVGGNEQRAKAAELFLRAQRPVDLKQQGSVKCKPHWTSAPEPNSAPDEVNLLLGEHVYASAPEAIKAGVQL